MLRPVEVGWFLSPARYRWSLVQLRNYGIIWRLIIEDWAGSLVDVVDGSGLAYVLIPSVLIKDWFVVGLWLRLNVPSHNGRITCSDCEAKYLVQSETVGRWIASQGGEHDAERRGLNQACRYGLSDLASAVSRALWLSPNSSLNRTNGDPSEWCVSSHGRVIRALPS
jgi:hypothetical protein